jgi:hypothetical protein
MTGPVPQNLRKSEKKPCSAGEQGSTGWKSRAGAWMLADRMPIRTTRYCFTAASKVGPSPSLLLQTPVASVAYGYNCDATAQYGYYDTGTAATSRRCCWCWLLRSLLFKLPLRELPLLVRFKHDAGGRPRMGSMYRCAHGNQCKDETGIPIGRNEGNWQRSSANCARSGAVSHPARCRPAAMANPENRP